MKRMKLYVCWTTSGGSKHSCGKAFDVLKEAGHEPEVVKVRGAGALPDVFNGGRKVVVEFTGQKRVPVLVTGDGPPVYPSDKIVEWARAHPA